MPKIKRKSDGQIFTVSTNAYIECIKSDSWESCEITSTTDVEMQEKKEKIQIEDNQEINEEKVYKKINFKKKKKE